MDDRDVSQLQDYSTRDRLSELPDSLIHIILSFLEMRDVVKTTLLSKRWKNLWANVPVLLFKSFSCNDDDDKDFVDPYTNFVNRALEQWKGVKILKFSLQLLSYDSVSSDVDRWILFAIEKQVEDLTINFRSGESRLYEPHRGVYSCSSITRLLLGNCRVNIDHDEIPRWSRLKTLLIHFNQPLDEDVVMNKFLCGAPHLEILYLGFAESGDDLNIESASLKLLMINRQCNVGIGEEGKNAMLRISAPNLGNLAISGVSYGRYSMEVPCLTKEAILDFNDREYCIKRYSDDGLFAAEKLRQVFLSIRRVENLTLSVWCIKALVELTKKGKFVEFSNAKVLDLQCVRAADEIPLVLEMFPNLVMLELNVHSHNYVGDVGNPNPSLDLSNLRRVEFTSDPFDTSIIPLAEVVLKNAHVLEKMVFRYQSNGAEAVGGSFASAEEKLLSLPTCSWSVERIRGKLNSP